MSIKFLADPTVRRPPPKNADLMLFESGVGHHAFLPDGSRIYDLDAATAAALANSVHEGGAALQAALASFATGHGPFIDDIGLEPPPLRSLSLNVAQTCNLACTYCYASGGDFGAPPATMPWRVAERAVRMLVDGAQPGERVHLAFLGGEPLIARDLIRLTVRLAREYGGALGVRTTFSITTNATLVTGDDVAFFADHGFAVTVSIDGVGDANDALRPFKRGGGSYARIIDRVAPLLERQHDLTVSARVTVTPRNLDLVDTLRGLLGVGFNSVGFSPMLRSPTGTDELAADDLTLVLEQMVACGRMFEDAVIAGQPCGFANEADALVQIHRGVHRPYPCGAGAGYLSVSATGDLAACHRFVEDPSGHMGDLEHGPDEERRATFLSDRHVHRQEPCSSCWARYLCGGGCHHEVIHRGRPACDYIRGWLQHCLGAYVRIMSRQPSYFSVPTK